MLTDACQGSEWRRGDWQARVLECTVTPIVLGFIQHPKPGPSILKGGAYGSHLISRAVWQRRVFCSLPVADPTRAFSSALAPFAHPKGLIARPPDSLSHRLHVFSPKPSPSKCVRQHALTRISCLVPGPISSISPHSCPRA